MIVKMFKLIVLLGILIVKIKSEWTHKSWLEENVYLLKWQVNITEQRITFLIEVKSKGWFSFGLTDRFGNKDLLLGWINDNGTAIIKDCYKKPNSSLAIDKSQDWNLLWHEQNKTHIIFKFDRKFDTCDLNDIKMENSSPDVVIFSNGDDTINNSIDIERFEIKGWKRLHLVSPNNDTPDDNGVLDLTINATISTNLTSYLCKIYRFENPVYIKKVEALSSVKNMIHHLLLFECVNYDPLKLDKYLDVNSFDCNNIPDLPAELKTCVRAFLSLDTVMTLMNNNESVWKIGIKSKYYMMQIHYTNLENKELPGIISGLRLHKASGNIKYEISELTIGPKLGDSIIIPARQDNFIIAGHCTTDCFPFKDYDNKFIKVYALHLHMHQKGMAIKVRHFRGGNELPWVAHDEYFLFFSHVKQHFFDPVVILPGDILTVECLYNTSNINKTTIYGEGIDEEMCIATMLYYPKMENISGYCQSRYSEYTMSQITGIKEFIGFGTTSNPKYRLPNSTTEYLLNPYLKNKSDWNKSLENILRFNPQIASCFWADVGTNGTKNTYVSYPDIKVPYSNSKCN